MRNIIKWLSFFIIVIHLTTGENVFLNGTSFQVKETQDNFTSKNLWIEVYNQQEIIGIFPMQKVLYTEIRA